MMRKSTLFLILITLFSIRIYGQEEKPQVSAEEMAKKLSNPVASLISAPFQNNTDIGIGEFNGSRNTLNIQPVIPIALGPKLNLITRVVLPVITQYDIYAEGTSQSGISDAVVSAFLSPSEAKGGVIWGVGPVFLLPIASDDLLGTKKWGVGPTALILMQTNGFTFGALANQIWSIAGDEDRSDINQMFLQPFVSYSWKSGAGLGVNAEITQNWNANTTSAFITPMVSGITKLGKLPVSLAIGPRLHVAAPDGSKAKFGIRAALTFVFPK